MKYYVTADVHGFFTPLRRALQDAGFFAETAPHKLVICGDLFDRGPEAAELQAFILQLLAQDRVILIRGNHEDLALQLLHSWHRESYYEWHHVSNGTVDTVWQLTDSQPGDLERQPDAVGQKLLHSPYIQTIIPAMLDRYETERYIFVHGWIPCTETRLSPYTACYTYLDNWREAAPDQWAAARWLNGMRAAHDGVTEPDKTIVCGHWHCSFGHANYEDRGAESGPEADYSPYYGSGVIALDANTARSGVVNCIVLEDQPSQ